MCNKRLCELIKQRRLDLNYSIEYASEIIGLPIDEVEEGSITLNSSNLCSLSKLLEINVNDLYKLNNYKLNN